MTKFDRNDVTDIGMTSAVGAGRVSLRMDNLISPSGGYSRFEEKPKYIVELSAEILEFDDKSVVCSVEVGDGECQVRSFDRNPLFVKWFLFVGMKVGLTIKTGAGWTQCTATYVPSIENAVVQAS